MNVVVCGSYGDFNAFLELLNYIKAYFEAATVFPDEAHMIEAEPSIIAHHVTNLETTKTIDVRSKLMDRYFHAIDIADIVIIRNEKNGKEYYGTGTTLELGYALARSKKVYLTRQPTNPNIISLLKSTANKSVIEILAPKKK